jgi:hypothetical protein
MYPGTRGLNPAAAAGSEHELGQPRFEVAAAPRELVGASASGSVLGVVATPVAAARHGEGVLPACRVVAQSCSGLSQLCL